MSPVEDKPYSAIKSIYFSSVDNMNIYKKYIASISILEVYFTILLEPWNFNFLKKYIAKVRSKVCIYMEGHKYSDPCVVKNMHYINMQYNAYFYRDYALQYVVLF